MESGAPESNHACFCSSAMTVPVAPRNPFLQRHVGLLDDIVTSHIDVALYKTSTDANFQAPARQALQIVNKACVSNLISSLFYHHAFTIKTVTLERVCSWSGCHGLICCRCTLRHLRCRQHTLHRGTQHNSCFVQQIHWCSIPGQARLGQHHDQYCT